MTKKELSQLYWINREIKKEKERLAELEAAATNTAAKISGLPHVSGISDKTAIAAQIADCKAIIEAKINLSVVEYNKLNRYIASIDDSYIRQILLQRYILGYSWTKVAMCLGGKNTPDGVRKAHNRFLSREK